MYVIIIAFALFSLFGCSDSNPVSGDEHHFEAVGCYVIQNTDTLIYYVNGIVKGEISVNSGSTSPLLLLRFISEDGDIGVPEEEEQSLSWEIANNSLAEASLDDNNDWGFRISGLNQGSTTIVITILHGEHPDFVSKPFPLIIN